MVKATDDDLRLPSDPTQPLTVDEAAAFMRCGINAVYDAIREKRLHAVKVGKSWRITREAIQRFLAGNVMP